MPQQPSNKLQLPTNEVLDQDKLHVSANEDGESQAEGEGLDVDAGKDGVATAGGMMLDGGKGRLSESSQLFRTQKMAGLAMLS